MNKKFFLVKQAGVAYVGPGDIVTGSTSWWGLRGYNKAYATGANPAMDVVDTATGLITTIINIKTSGALDVAAIAVLGYPVSVKKLYDQTGNGHHMLQATLAAMPTITLNGLGTLPTMVFNGTSSRLSESGTLAIALPFTISSVFNSDNHDARIWRTTAGGMSHGSALANQVLIFGTANLGVTGVTDGSFHAGQGAFNGGSSNFYIDGSDNTGNTGTFATASYQQSLGSNGTVFLQGKIQEAGYWPVAFSAGNNSNMNSNQHTYWGF